jgi:pseudaminic acid cytidylyltransferase
MRVAIIPARGGSKRIPKKNIKPFHGKPLISYSIEVALKSNLFDHVLVSTDSKEISDIAINAGAEVPFTRSQELSDDYSTTDAVFIDSIDWVQKNWGACDEACCIYPTAPLLEVEYLENGLEELIKHQAVSAFSVTNYDYSIWRSFKMNDQGRLELNWPEMKTKRSQDLDDAYHDAGQFYWVNIEKYMKEKSLFSQNSVPVLIPRHKVQDIDTPEDWIMAERLYQITNM